MPRTLNPLIYIMAIALGLLLALGVPRATAAEECASFENFLAQAEKISAAGGGKPFFFHPKQGKNKAKPDQIDYQLYVYFASDRYGYFFFWNSNSPDCKAKYVTLPAAGFLQMMGKKERDKMLQWKAPAKGLRGA